MIEQEEEEAKLQLMGSVPVLIQPSGEYNQLQPVSVVSQPGTLS